MDSFSQSLSGVSALTGVSMLMLMEIPEDFGSICTLEWIELSGCSDAATSSAIEIQKYQMSIGNDWLTILLNTGMSKPMHKRGGRSGC